MSTDAQYIQRCLTLARRGMGYVAPNPMVGAVLVHKEKIIGEGWHERFGGPHAEVNCVADAIRSGNESLITESTLYVNLEPCSHHGKTPPCTDLIIKHRIPRVVIGCTDPFNEVNGKGIARLRAAGIDAITGILEEDCREINKRFFVFHTHQRPYVILKWAQTKNGIMGVKGSRLLITDDYTNFLVHLWRSRESAILVGKNTAITDDPLLTNRKWPGPSPVRMFIDLNLEARDLKLQQDGGGPVVIFNASRHDLSPGNEIRYYQVDPSSSIVEQILSACVEMNLQSLIVEGGAKLIQTFLDATRWDEARVIISANEFQENTNIIAAPLIPAALEKKQNHLVRDTIHYFTPQQNI